MPKHDKINDRAKQGDVDLVFIGDSITDGWQNGSDRGGKLVWEKYYGNRKAMNAGIGGDKTQACDMAARERQHGWPETETGRDHDRH